MSDYVQPKVGQTVNVLTPVYGITTEHREYIINHPRWDKIRNFSEGRAKQYIPDITYINCNEIDPDKLHFRREANRVYRDNAAYVNFTAQTKRSIVALMTNQPPIEFTVPPALDYVEECATGDGLTLKQLLDKLCGDCLTVARVGLITEYPQLDLDNNGKGLSPSDVDSGVLVPHMFTFDAAQIINWGVDYDEGYERLQFIVVRKNQPVPSANSRFIKTTRLEYFVAELDADGHYCQGTYFADGTPVPGKETFYPKKAGQFWDVVPVTILGADNNNVKCDDSPIESVVELSHAHLNLSAAYMDNLRKYCRGTVVLESDLPPKDLQNSLAKRPLVMGEEEAMFVGKVGKITIAQLAPGQEAATAMAHLEELIQLVGGHIVTPRISPNIAYETLKLSMAGQISTAEIIIGNVEAAIYQHLIWHCDYLGIDSSQVVFQMSRQLLKESADYNLMNAITASVRAGTAPQSMANDYNRKVDLIPYDTSDDEIASELENTNRTGIPSNFDNQNPNTPLTANAVGTPKNVNTNNDKVALNNTDVTGF
jgi:hypothetical protein